MKRGTRNFLVALMIIAGFVFLFPALNITGNVVGQRISETTGKVINSIVGLALIVGGLVLFMARGKRERSRSPLEDMIIEELNVKKGKPQILLDSEFLMTLYNLQKDENLKLPQNFFGDYEAIITPKVYNEVKRVSKRTGHPGVSRKFLNNLKKNYGVVLDQNINPEQRDIDDMIYYWENYTPQGKLDNPFERKKFKKGADSEMLAYAYIRDRKPTAIISENYSEIGKISDALREKLGVNVKTYRTSEVLSKIA